MVILIITDFGGFFYIFFIELTLKTSSKLAEVFGHKKIPAEVAKYLMKIVGEKIEDEKADRAAFEKELDTVSDEEL